MRCNGYIDSSATWRTTERSGVIRADVHGNVLGLKKSQLRSLDRIRRRRATPNELASWELLKYIAQLSAEFRRQIGVLLDRKGSVAMVVVGTFRSLQLPQRLEARVAATRLSGFRLIHTQLEGSGLARRDITDLSLHRLDLVASVDIDARGFPGDVHVGHIDPMGSKERPVVRLTPTPYLDLEFDFPEFISNLESDLRKRMRSTASVWENPRAILCAMGSKTTNNVEELLEETKELSSTAGLEIIDTFVQFRDKPDPKYFIGRGKLEEISLRAAQEGVDHLLFQQNLTPNQSRHISDLLDLPVLDRTQLILDIFAQRARSYDGKLQVELAQLRYTLPRLREMNTDMSRLVGGIGGRGPGETKLEIHRRRARERMQRLEQEISRIARKRAQKRELRKRKHVPTVSIVGYTNAGKSTLLNTLTHATATAEAKLFATLDPFSKRLRFPRDRELILTDTVGFIRDLPKELLSAFRATLEEIGEADLILHVVDVSNERFEHHIEIVNRILRDLGFGKIPQLLVLNKTDLLTTRMTEGMAKNLKGIPITATEAESCRQLLTQMEARLWSQQQALKREHELVSTPDEW